MCVQLWHVKVNGKKVGSLVRGEFRSYGVGD